MRALFLPLAALFLSAPAARADDAADAKAVVEKSVKALGYKAGDKFVAMTWKDKGKFTGGGMTADYAGEWAFQIPDKGRFDITVELGGMKINFVGIVNGNKGWESGFGMTQELADEKLEYVQNQIYLLNVTALLPLLADK